MGVKVNQTYGPDCGCPQEPSMWLRQMQHQRARARSGRPQASSVWLCQAQHRHAQTRSGCPQELSMQHLLRRGLFIYERWMQITFQLHTRHVSLAYPRLQFVPAYAVRCLCILRSRQPTQLQGGSRSGLDRQWLLLQNLEGNEYSTT